MPKEFIHLLLIDDDEITNHIHQTVISAWEGAKVHVHIFNKAKEALATLTRSKTEKGSLPDYIFLDLNMPEMNGWEFLDQYEKLDLGVPIFVLSSSINSGDKERAIGYSAVEGYITKPLNTEILTNLNLFR